MIAHESLKHLPLSCTPPFGLSEVMRENAEHVPPIKPVLHFFDSYFNEWS